MATNKINLPSKRSIEEAIKRFEDFRSFCQYELDVGLWGTIDFPSKHHINKILQLQYKKQTEIVEFYGPGLADHINKVIPKCKAYVLFLRDGSNEQRNN